MKLRGGKQIHYDSGPNMTSLVDVVMVILIFLMLTGQFVVQEHYLVSNLPLRRSSAGNVAPPPGGFPEYELLEIRVDQNATRDGFVARVGQFQTDDVKILAAGLKKLADQYTKADPSLDKVQVVISPGRAVKYSQIVEIYQAALEAQFKKIGFSTAR
jgi:biopolymer transport protein ExbD